MATEQVTNKSLSIYLTRNYVMDSLTVGGESIYGAKFPGKC